MWNRYRYDWSEEDEVFWEDDTIWETEMGCALCKHVEIGNAYKILVVKPEEKRLLGSLWVHGKVSNVTMDLRQAECEAVGYTDLAQEKI